MWIAWWIRRWREKKDSKPTFEGGEVMKICGFEVRAVTG
jgi:hypothetical protein